MLLVDNSEREEIDNRLLPAKISVLEEKGLFLKLLLLSIFMTIKEFLKLPFLKAPFERPANQDFYSYALENLILFSDELKKVENFIVVEQNHWKGMENVRLVQESSNNLKNSVIKVLQLYLDGKPSEGYVALKAGLESGEANLPNWNFGVVDIKEDENLFRIRTCENTFSFKPCELFHIPMNQREVVSSQRFSIPGYPCLYFSNSTYLCWLELGKPDLMKSHTSLFQVFNDPNGFENIVLLDLTNSHSKLLAEADKNVSKWDSTLFRFLSLWPLIFITSVKVRDRSKYFKPEYIIPQLLLQYVKESGFGKNKISLHGIKYSSTHYNKYKNKPNFYNVAIPIRSSTIEPYCNFLTNKFQFTVPCSWEHLNLLNVEMELLEKNKDLKAKSVEKLVEFTTDNPSDYYTSKFGIMEAYLEGCKKIRIDVNGEVIQD